MDNLEFSHERSMLVTTKLEIQPQNHQFSAILLDSAPILNNVHVKEEGNGFLEKEQLRDRTAVEDSEFS